MSLRSLSLFALLFLTTPAMAGERLLVAASDGAVYLTAPDRSEFTYFACGCIGPASAMAADRNDLYLVDEVGRLMVADLTTGAPESIVLLQIGEVTALASTGTALFAGTTTGLVARIDPLTGESSQARIAPAGVRALATIGDGLFAATADGAIYRADVESGEFTYFSCFCFSNLQDLIVDGGDLIAGDAGGFIIRIDGTDGTLLSGQWAGPLTALAVSGGDYLFHAGGGVIHRMDGESGMPMGGLKSPNGVRAMLVVADEVPLASPKGPRFQKR
jgi:hypothetical protein